MWQYFGYEELLTSSGIIWFFSISYLIKHVSLLSVEIKAFIWLFCMDCGITDLFFYISLYTHIASPSLVYLVCYF